MTRARNHQWSGGMLLLGLAVLAVLIYRPGWVAASFTAYAHFWDAVVSPVVVRLLTRG